MYCLHTCLCLTGVTQHRLRRPRSWALSQVRSGGQQSLVPECEQAQELCQPHEFCHSQHQHGGVEADNGVGIPVPRRLACLDPEWHGQPQKRPQEMATSMTARLEPQGV